MEKALDIFQESMDMAKAVSYINNYEQQRAEIMKREEERRRLDEEKNGGKRKNVSAGRNEKLLNGRTRSGNR